MRLDIYISEQKITGCPNRGKWSRRNARSILLKPGVSNESQTGQDRQA